MNKLKILQINSSKIWSGGEVHLKDLIKGLLDRNHEIFLASRSHIKDHFENLNINLNILPFKNAVDIYTIYKLSQIIKINDIDIIHVHNGKDYWLAYFARLLARRGKIVATRHITVPLSNSFLHKKMLKNIDKFIAVSNQVRKILINKNFIEEENINVIYNGVNLKDYNNIDYKYLYRELGVDKNNLIIGVVGALCKRKNQLFVVDIAKNIDSSDVKFIIVGEDFTRKKTYKKKLLNRIKKEGLEDNIILTGYRTDIPEFMALFDVLLVPSKREAFGIVAIEAMASKTPVIANDIDGLKEIVIENSGWLLSINKINEFIELILKINLEKNKIEKKADNALLNVQNRFSLEKMVNDTIKVYRQSM